ncbi:transcriptional regulator [Bernardetia litoralis DSM 6794]|uniref:Transcriptional regulator n=1 Tax=Bernardetia litoralis (strain ATCC 23117 / DSM 6794 / NBRC 15988 / NCIMB 1366 / Fx l1 / Sio-4) TaxID=880071 RepID=I4AG32_BERLS|nr:TetR/AcrR family transcriptional regulator [Bernardetia litoralis]AFM02917.1 transcriptional regulator [Bernardetia litoralis DSM 6794]
MARKKQFEEREILTKATNLFWKQGFHATSIQDLVNHLKINRASLYDTFGGKEELFNKALENYRNQSKEEVQSFLNNQSSVKEGLKNLFLLAITGKKETQENGCFVINCITELIPNSDNILEIATQNKEEFEGFFLEFLKKGVENGEVSPQKDIESIAAFLFVFYNGLKVVGKINSSKEELEKAIEVGLAIL